MPIWRSSELLTGRPGSPARKTSSRSSASQSNSSRSPALPPLGNSTDGTHPDEQPAGSVAGPSQTAACYPNLQRPASGCSSVNSYTNWEASPAGPGGHHGASGTLAAPRSLSRQNSRPDSRGNISACVPGLRTNSYTVQYIGIANGELGILSQKQKLTIPVTVPGSAGSGGPPPGSNVVMCRRRRPGPFGASAASPRAPTLAVAISTTTTAAATAPGAAAAATARPPLPPSRPPSSLSPRPPPLPVFVPDPAEPAAGLYDVAAAGGGGGTTETETDEDSPTGGRAQPPSLVDIVDNAHGQVKVISECFYSRALHSRAGPHDRHARRNRPAGPQVKDMEPLRAALPGCFAHRAPSAGGFPGWKLTGGAATAAAAVVAVASFAPRRTYSGTGSGGFGSGAGGPGFGSGFVPGPGPASAARQQRAASAQPLTGSGAAGVEATGATAAAAAAASSPSRATDAGSGRGDGNSGDGAASSAAATGGGSAAWDVKRRAYTSEGAPGPPPLAS